MQKDLKDKTTQLQQVEQMCRKQKQELENRAAKLSELDQLMEGLKVKLEQSREDSLLLKQQLRNTK